jgi:UPF0716 protein FxsA
MFIRLLLILTIVPLTELVLLLRLAEEFSWQSTLALVVLTGVLGAWLARRQGIRTFARIQNELERGTLPADALIDAALILVAGLVLVTPGILTDLLGFALLVPPIRRWLMRRVAKACKKYTVVIRNGSSEDFVDVEGTGSTVDQPPHDRFIEM